MPAIAAWYGRVRFRLWLGLGYGCVGLGRRLVSAGEWARNRASGRSDLPPDVG
jgi:hypothetical protein